MAGLCLYTLSFGLLLGIQIEAFLQPSTLRISHPVTTSSRGLIDAAFHFSSRLKANNLSNNDQPTNLLSNTRNLVQEANDQETILKTMESVQRDRPSLDRRKFFGSTLIAVSATTTLLPLMDPSRANAMDQFGRLQWESTPINKRTGVTLFDAEKTGYSVRFVTYLARFLLVFDFDCQKWWYSKAADIPRRASSDEVVSIRLSQFGAFAASVEVGLQDYNDPVKGPVRLLESLLRRYSPDLEDLKAKRAAKGLPKYTEAEELRERREIKEARRQIALLFGLMEVNQPVERIDQLLAAIDNGSISSVRIEDGGAGYAPGYGAPVVQFPPPKAGPYFETAKGRALLKPNGRVLRIDVASRGQGYTKAPVVTITPPAASKAEAPNSPASVTPITPIAATAKALLFKNGPNKGQIERIELIDAGAGYADDEPIIVQIAPPEGSKGPKRSRNTVQPATANVIREYYVAAIEIVEGGSGYAIEKPIPIFVEPPPVTARVNLNDPQIVQRGILNEGSPASQQQSKQQEDTKKLAKSSDPETFQATMEKMAKNDGKGGGGGCIGRACYDRSVVAYATAKAEASSFSTFRNETDVMMPVEMEAEALNEIKTVSAVTGGNDSRQPVFYSGSPTSSSAQLLTLLPAGFGLQYDSNLKRFVLSAGEDFPDINGAAAGVLKVPLDPEFGPRGRSPIERDLTLDGKSFLRFCASGAVCASGAHFILTPLDVIKTKIQTDPENYPGVGRAFQKLVDEAGLAGFFAGWVPTFIGFFCWGGFSYSVTELLRRYFNELLGTEAASFEVPVIIAAATISSFFSVFILCPFEAVRIRSVAQPGYGKNIVDTTSRMVREEGVGSLFSAVPPFMLKEIPFGVAKFFVFTISTRFLFETFPAAQEDIQLSLAVSLAGGMMGGLAAAIVSNPADATISEMKKAQTKMGPVVAVQTLIERGGYPNLMRGLPVRMLFYPLITSMQFFVYDAVRLYLGVGADDLKVYLDVLGGALQDGGGFIGPA